MNSNWLFSKKMDLLILFLPVWLCWVAAFLLPVSALRADVPLWVWVVFVIGIDVSHVWSTLFRTYTDQEEFHNHKGLLLTVPVLAFLVSWGVASISFALFWRILAYVAVFHFVKQQYGFMRIYKARSADFRSKFISDNFIIYLSMIFPVIYWHLNPNRHFSWFVTGDFLQFKLPITVLSSVNFSLQFIYFGLLLLWIWEEIRFARLAEKAMPWGKILWVITTAGNWYIGIVYFNSDLVFTLTNVVAHGIPYMALIVFYQHEKHRISGKQAIYKKLIPAAVFITGIAFILAFGEEYLWDALINHDNASFFSWLYYPDELPPVNWQAIALALLSVPQITHYVADGFIWKNSPKNPHLKNLLTQ